MLFLIPKSTFTQSHFYVAPSNEQVHYLNDFNSQQCNLIKKERIINNMKSFFCLLIFVSFDNVFSIKLWSEWNKCIFDYPVSNLPFWRLGLITTNFLFFSLLFSSNYSSKFVHSVDLGIIALFIVSLNIYFLFVLYAAP